MANNKTGCYGEEYFTMRAAYNRDSDIEWVSMDFNVPVNAILREYNQVKDSLNLQRPEYDHKDWHAVTLYGFGSHLTKSHWEYRQKGRKFHSCGIKPDVTDIGEKCHGTLKWVRSLPYARIDDVRFLVIKPGGYISKHIDVPEHNWLDPLNISLTYPEGSKFILNEKEVPYKAGASIVLNVHYEHYVENNSDEERIHLVIHGKKNKDFWSQVSEVPGI